MKKRIGFLVNPVAGMGGRVGLKGTDGVVDRAKKLGAHSIAPAKAEEMLHFFNEIHKTDENIQWVTCQGIMGEQALNHAHQKHIATVYKPKDSTTADDTKKACQELMKQGIDLIVFCGGDGTARDIFEIVKNSVPLLGIPSGVKMHSAVFGITSRATAKMLHEFLQGTLTVGDADIMDLDEDLYRKGEWNIRLFGIAQGIIEPTYVQVGKTTFESVSEQGIKDELAEHIEDEMNDHPDMLFLLGSGGTIEYIAQKIGVEHTLLGIDAVFQKKTIQKDVNEQAILSLLKKYQKVKLILSPIGAQGFILGRGNLQLSPEIISAIGIDNIIIVSTPGKLAATPYLRVDTGDEQLDKTFADKGFFLVVVGYRFSKVQKVQTNNF